MELRVTVGGVERVVCGVTPATTCQQVIIALAQATGRTGSFTLVEHWGGHIERPMAPTDRPLALLQTKWNGKYASSGGEVEFILKQSEAVMTAADPDSFSQSQATKVRKNARMLVRKSLSFSGAHHHGEGAHIANGIRPRVPQGLRLSKRESEDVPEESASYDQMDSHGKCPSAGRLDSGRLEASVEGATSRPAPPPPPKVRPVITPRTSLRKSKAQKMEGGSGPEGGRSAPTREEISSRLQSHMGETNPTDLVRSAQDEEDRKALISTMEKNGDALKAQEKLIADIQEEIVRAQQECVDSSREAESLKCQIDDYQRLSVELSAEALAYPAEDNLEREAHELASLENNGRQLQAEIDDLKGSLEDTEGKLANCEGMMETRLQDQVNTALRQIQALDRDHTHNANLGDHVGSIELEAMLVELSRGEAEFSQGLANEKQAMEEAVLAEAALKALEAEIKLKEEELGALLEKETAAGTLVSRTGVNSPIPYKNVGYQGVRRQPLEYYREASRPLHGLYD